MSVFEAVKVMSKSEFVAFCETLYEKGKSDGRNYVDDGAWIRQRLADYPVDSFWEVE